MLRRVVLALSLGAAAAIVALPSATATCSAQASVPSLSIPAAPAEGTVVPRATIRVTAARPGLHLYRVVEQRSFGIGDFSDFARVCAAPCTTTLAEGDYLFGVGHGAGPPVLDDRAIIRIQHGRALEIDWREGNDDAYWGCIIAAGALALIGFTTAGIAIAEAPERPIAGPHLVGAVIGLGLVVLALPLPIIGLAVRSNDRGHVEVLR